MAIVLTITCGGESRTLRFDREIVTLGRDPGSGIPLDDAALSRTHCQFERLGDAVYVRDLNSRNGTRVGGTPVQRRKLEPGDVVGAGGVTVTFEGVDAPSGRAAAGGRALKRLLRRPRAKRARGDVEEENRRLRELLGITRQLVSELDHDRVLASIIDSAIDLTAAERGFLVVFRGDDLSVEIARNFWRKDVDAPELEISRNIADAVRAAGRPLLVEDASKDTRFHEFLSVCALKLRSVWCLPLAYQGEVKGVLYLDNRFNRGTFHEEDREMIESFADLAAVALVNSGRFEAELRARRVLQEEVRRKHAELLRAEEALEEERAPRGLRHRFAGIVARSPAMRRLLEVSDRVIPTALPLLIEGASGTGKEHLARLIHSLGPRAGRPFVALACAALPATLAEVELFGHGRGAYTGAGEARGGLLEQAEGGTLFLDGVEDLERDAQALFLRVLEAGEFRRVGEQQTRRADVRVIAASRVPLEEVVREQRFRRDLYFRLKGVRLTVPSLTDRREDLPGLLEQVLAEDAPDLVVSPGARRALLERSWPGNVRELRLEVQRLALLGLPAVDAEHVARPADDGPTQLRAAVAALERRLIADALRRHSGNRTRAARELGLSRLGLRKKLERFGLGAPEEEAPDGGEAPPPGGEDGAP